jgi:hypothetical protein
LSTADEPGVALRKSGESPWRGSGKPQASTLFWFWLVPFLAENCDPDVTVFDKISPNALETAKTPKKAAVAPVFCFTLKP